MTLFNKLSKNSFSSRTNQWKHIIQQKFQSLSNEYNLKQANYHFFRPSILENEFRIVWFNTQFCVPSSQVYTTLFCKRSYSTKGNPFWYPSAFKKMFEKEQYEEIIHQYREMYMIRYDVNDPLKPSGSPKPVDTVYYLNALSKVNRIRELYEAFRYLLNPKNPSSLVFNTMFKCLLDLNLYDDAVKLYLKGIELHESNRAILNARTINVFMKYFLKHGRYDDAIALYEKHCNADESSKIKIYPDSKTINLVSKLYVKRGDLALARHVLESECLKFRVNPDSDSAFRLMKSHIARNNLEEAYWLFIDFFTQEPESEVSNPLIRLLEPAYPSTKVLATLMHAYYMNNDPDTAQRLFEKFCSPRTLQEEVINFKNGQAVNEVVEREITPLFVPNPELVRIMIEGLSRNGRLTEAESIYDTFFKGENPPLTLTRDVAEEMLASYSFSKSTKTSYYFKTHFLPALRGKKGFTPTYRAILSMMWYLQNVRKPEESISLYIRWSKSSEYKPEDLPHFQGVIQSILKSIEVSDTVTDDSKKALFSTLIPFAIKNESKTLEGGAKFSKQEIENKIIEEEEENGESILEQV